MNPKFDLVCPLPILLIFAINRFQSSKIHHPFLLGSCKEADLFIGDLSKAHVTHDMYAIILGYFDKKLLEFLAIESKRFLFVKQGKL
jgi:hypothetical protein